MTQILRYSFFYRCAARLQSKLSLRDNKVLLDLDYVVQVYTSVIQVIQMFTGVYRCNTGIYVYAFSRRFNPKQLTNEDITLQLTSKLTISYIEGKHLSDSVKGVRGDSVEIECRHTGKYRKIKYSRGSSEEQGKC